jgi:RNA polymerase-binding transcription factor DksA
MKKKPVKKTNKAKKAPAKKVAPKKVAKKSKPVAKKPTPAKKKVEKKVVKAKQKPVAKKAIKKPEPKKVKAEIKKAPVAVAKKVTQPVVKPAPKAEVKPTPIVNIEPKKNIVDKPKPSNTNEKKNYSEKELAEFRTLIVDKLDQAKKDYELLKNTLCHTDDHGTDDTSPTFKALEDGSDVLTREETAQLALRQEKFIQNLQNALVRIQNKTYGICRVTGTLIPKERLMRVPHATLSIDAKKEQQFNQ